MKSKIMLVWLGCVGIAFGQANVNLKGSSVTNGSFVGNGSGLTNITATSANTALTANYATVAGTASNLAGSLCSKFKAGVNTNIFYSTGTSKMLMSNLVYGATGGSVYDTTNSRWYPKNTNTIEFFGQFDIGTWANGDLFQIFIYRNGTNIATVVDALMRAGNYGISWTFVQAVQTSSNDYFEVYINHDAALNRSTIGGVSNNWWYGVTIP